MWAYKRRLIVGWARARPAQCHQSGLRGHSSGRLMSGGRPLEASESERSVRPEARPAEKPSAGQMVGQLLRNQPLYWLQIRSLPSPIGLKFR